MSRLSSRSARLATTLLLTSGLAASGCARAPAESDEEDADGREALGHISGYANGSSGAPDSKFHVVHMTPGPETHTAKPFSEVCVRFSRAIDPDTIDAQTVLLRERESLRTVPVSVHVHGVHMTITPLRPLNTNYRYTVDLEGVGSQSGHTASFEARFFTAPHHPSLYLRYTNAVAARPHVFSWDGDAGYLRIDHLLPGIDGVLQTADDPQDQLSERYYDPEQDHTHTHVRGIPGPDGEYDTADDFHQYERTMTYSAAGETSRQVERFGADGLMGTADDYFEAEELSYYDAVDRLAYKCNGTACTRYVYTSGERATLVLTGAGLDGVWRTDDDDLDSEWGRSFFDQYGVQTGSETHDLALDGTPTPSDATLKGYTDITLANGLPTEYRTYEGPGLDGLWRTADDVGTLLRQYSYDEDGLRQTWVDYEPGPDGQLGTADDELAAEWFY